jgi:shikimate dehydrogenase
MRLFGLIGYPLAHSFSKKYFTEKFEKEMLSDCAYENFPIISVEKFTSILQNYPQLKGLNVTIPYKEQIIPFLDEASETVKAIGACNCIKIFNGKLIGHNTDTTAFERSLKKELQPNHKKALILGTGGSAKAVEFVLRKLNIEYRYVSRKSTGENLTYEQVTPSVIEEYELIINTTPLGMFPDISMVPLIPYDALTAKHFLFDLIYNPEKTLFLQRGEEKGATIKNGLEMLVIQAEESWRIWNS